jgi:V/A-type H+-transporting ATPase subunit D
LLTFGREAGALRQRVEQVLRTAYEQLALAYATHGEAGLERLAMAARPFPPVDVRERSLMGVGVPVVQTRADHAVPDAALSAAAGGSGLAAEAAAFELAAALPALIELAELESSCLRLARQLTAVRRKLNALERVHIPAHGETIRFIADQLEEREREQLFQLKRIRAVAQERP